jgi:23S rRNA (guanine745-N1)-methyltransferase
LHGQSLCCERGHSFDIARQGYINLLSAGDKRSKDPGDSREMVVARGDFLDRGHYQPVAQRMAELLLPQVGTGAVVLDAGCGEGYYLQQLDQACLSSDFPSVNFLGLDISKWAVQAAARRLPATWLVASNRNIPVADHCVDALLSVFGFPAYDSFRKALKQDGLLLLVNAGPRHLIELREVIYPTVRSSESPECKDAVAAGFSLQETNNLTYRTGPLSPVEIAELLLMTPHLFRATREGKERAAKLEEITLTVDVRFHLLRCFC